MSYIPQIQNTLDPNNSSTTVLAANASFTGTGTNVTRYQSIYVTVFSTQASATNGLTIQFSQDNVNWVTSSSLTVTASQNLSTTINISAQYFRIVYTNGGTLQTTFRLQTCLQVTSTVMAARINALQDSGAYVPLSSDANQNLNIVTNLNLIVIVMILMIVMIVINQIQIFQKQNMKMVKNHQCT